MLPRSWVFDGVEAECSSIDLEAASGKSLLPAIAALVNLSVLFVIVHFKLAPTWSAVVGSLFVFVGTNVLTLQDIFGNAPTLLAVVTLHVASEALAASGAIEYAVENALLGRKFTGEQAALRLSLFSTMLAMFTSFHLATLLLLGSAKRIAKRNALHADALISAMRTAASIGAHSTLMGCAGNLLVVGLAKQYLCITITGFDLFKIGLPISALLLSYRLASFKYIGTKSDTATAARGKEPLSRFHTHFTFDAVVPITFNGKTIEEAGFRNLDGLFLTSARCGNAVFPVVGPDFKLRTGDRISFAGVAAKFLSFCNERGLTPVTENDEQSYWLEDFTLEAVVSATSDLVGKSMKRVNFRTRYGASVLAIHRVGQSQAKFPQGKLGQVVLQVGDLLLLVVSDAFDWQKPMTRRDLKPRFATTAATALYFDTQMPSAREYIFTMRVNSPVLNNRTVEECGLGELHGARIIAISRDNLTSKGVSIDFSLQLDDILWFSGERHGLLTLRRLPGLEDVEYMQIRQHNLDPQARALFECAVGLHSDLLHKTVRESRFGTRFGAVIVAIQRQQEFNRNFTKIGDIELLPGDVLMVDAQADEFATRFAGDDNFLVISRMDRSSPPRLDRAPAIVAALVAGVFAPIVLGVDVPLVSLGVLACLIVCQVLPRNRALIAVDFDLVSKLMVCYCFAVVGMKTGVAFYIALCVSWLGVNEIGVIVASLAVLQFAGFRFPFHSQVMPALAFPIVVIVAQLVRVDPSRMLTALLIGAHDYEHEQQDWRILLAVKFTVFVLWEYSLIVGVASFGVLLGVIYMQDPTFITRIARVALDETQRLGRK